ncbi:MAG: ATP-binding protein [Clostridiales bacterium]|nr:ATP-binding protein [Clostridiales bacterium]
MLWRIDMILLIAGASHTGKTAFAQKLLLKYGYPYLSIDHLKMGLIRSRYTTLTPFSDDHDLTNYLWPIVREMIKTAIENKQNLIVEGCYIPFDWANSFEKIYLEHIRYRCLVMSKAYIRGHYQDIKKHANTIENRGDDSDCTIESLIEDNWEMLIMCKRYGLDYILIDDIYPAKMDFDMN